VTVLGAALAAIGLFVNHAVDLSSAIRKALE
jgi:hypothetical protein